MGEFIHHQKTKR